MIKKKLKIQLVDYHYFRIMEYNHSIKQSLHQACIDVSFLLLPIWTSK